MCKAMINNIKSVFRCRLSAYKNAIRIRKPRPKFLVDLYTNEAKNGTSSNTHRGLGGVAVRVLASNL